MAAILYALAYTAVSMRAALVSMVLLALFAPLATAQSSDRIAASFEMAEGFDDVLTLVSGEVDLRSPDIQDSAGFFRVSAVSVTGIRSACWSAGNGTGVVCADGPLTIHVPAGASFGFKTASPFDARIQAAHALVTFVDLSRTDGFDERLRVGPSAIMSLVGGTVAVGPMDVPAGLRGAFTTLEESSTIEVRTTNGTLLHTASFDDEPVFVEGSPKFPSTFASDVVVLPFGNDSTARFKPAAGPAVREGLSDERLDLLDQILRDVRFLDAGTRSTPQAIVAKAGDILSEIVNGALIRARLSDNPNSLSDVGFARFEELDVRGIGATDVSFDGSFTLVAGDLGPAFESSEVASTGLPLRWWMVALLVVAAISVAAWFILRGGAVPETAPGPQHWLARVMTAIGAVALFLIWDWQLNLVLGSSLLTTQASGGALGVLMAVQLASLTLALLLIGVPTFFAVRYGLALLHKPDLQSLSTTSGVFMTLGLGLLVLPALVSFLFNLAA